MSETHDRSVRRLALAACAATVLIAACGGGSSGGSAAPDASSAVPTSPVATTPDPADPKQYFPIGRGDVWVYRKPPSAYSLSGPTYEIDRIGSTVAIENAEWTAMETRAPIRGAVGTVDYYRKDATGVYTRLGLPGSADDVWGSLMLYRLPFRVGDSYVSVDLRDVPARDDRDRDGVEDSLDMRVEVSVEATESVTVPAGTFADALRVRTTAQRTYKGRSSIVSVRTTVTEWLAPGIGPVRRLVEDKVGAQEATISDYSLYSYRVGSQTNDALGPNVKSSVDVATSNMAARLAFAIEFDEPIDQATLIEKNVTLTASDGRSWQVGVALDGSRVLLEPPISPLPEGRYVARVGKAITDLVGNGMAADYEWPLRVDNSGPRPVVTSPAAGATNVAWGSPVVVDFDEEVDPARASLVHIFLAGPPLGSYSAGVTVNGSRATLGRTMPLQNGATYTATVSGAYDRLGNPMASGYSWQFTVEPGPFQQPAFLSVGSWPDSVTISDVTGDGRNDVVLLTTGYGNDPVNDFMLKVFAQPPSPGPLTTSRDYPAGRTCGASSMQAGDVNGDGRKDVVIGNSDCGFEVKLQASDGTLQASSFFPTMYARWIWLADIDGDGQDEVIGTNFSDRSVAPYGPTDITQREVRIWKRSPAGTWSQIATLLQTISNPQMLYVADLTGDGRADILTLTSGGRYYDIRLFVQDAGGNFVARQLLAGDSDIPELWIADLDSDGRTDLILSSPAGTGSWVMRQEAPGVFASRKRISDANFPNFRFVDVNGDGRKDIVSGAVTVHLQQADGTFAEAGIWWSLSGGQAGNSAVGDVNGDGLPDVAVPFRDGKLGLFYHYPAQAAAAQSVTAALKSAAPVGTPKAMRGVRARGLAVDRAL